MQFEGALSHTQTSPNVCSPTGLSPNQKTQGFLDPLNPQSALLSHLRRGTLP